MVKVYIAHAMTGRPGNDVVKESYQAKIILGNYNIQVLDPVTVESVKSNNVKISVSNELLQNYWRRDKKMIRESHVLLDLTPERKSEGVSHEIGYARYFLWKPVIRVYPFSKKPSNLSVALFEDDFITDSLNEAATHIIKVHGTWMKRSYWRLKLLIRCFMKATWYQLKEWK